MVCIILCSLYMIYVYDYVMFCHFDRVSDVLLRMLYDYRIDMSYHMLYDCDVDNRTVKCHFVLLYNI